MIYKQYEAKRSAGDKMLDAGNRAEHQMARHLHGAFANDKDLMVLNDLRIADPTRTDMDGSPWYNQMDHLVLHQWGAFIIESKSVSSEVGVKQAGGGDYWFRRFGRSQSGMKSPVDQAIEQGKSLRNILKQDKHRLRGKGLLGRQHGFDHLPIQITVAISEKGIFKPDRSWIAPKKPFPTYVLKAEQVVQKIVDEIAKHKRASGLFSKADGKYGVWSFNRDAKHELAEEGRVDELHLAARFLELSHKPLVRQAVDTPAVPEQLPPQPKRAPAINPETVARAKGVFVPSCKDCNSTNLVANSGRYGYYWSCADCTKNTSMSLVCPSCTNDGFKDKSTKIHKDGPVYALACNVCKSNSVIWVEAGAGGS